MTDANNTDTKGLKDPGSVRLIEEAQEGKKRIMELIHRLREATQKEWTERLDCACLEQLDVATQDYWPQSYILRMAEDCATPPQILEQLVLCCDPDIHLALVDNPATPLSVLKSLTKSDQVDVRYAMAENHNLEITILDLLTDDDNPYVADRAQRTLSRISSGAVIYSQFKPNQNVGSRHSVRA